ncbi:MAG: hypothetical protein ACP5HQ_09130, partial [Thermoprotei archaeon]
MSNPFSVEVTADVQLRRMAHDSLALLMRILRRDMVYPERVATFKSVIASTLAILSNLDKNMRRSVETVLQKSVEEIQEELRKKCDDFDKELAEKQELLIQVL